MESGCLMLPDFVTSPYLLLLWGAFGYLLGAVPFGIVVARGLGLGDPRRIGSGNIGATNVLRTGSKLGAGLTLILDAGKAGLATLLALHFAAEDAAQLAGAMALLGHCYPVYLKFQGGKGVATFYGLLFALSWPLGIAAGITWLAMAAMFRLSSLAALMTAVFAPLWALQLEQPSIVALLICLAALIVWRHKDNITRLRAGVEGKIGDR